MLVGVSAKTGKVSAVFNTWDLSSIITEHSICAPYLGSGYVEKMSKFQHEVDEMLEKKMPDTGTFGARLFHPDRSCALHAKLWVVKDTVAAVVTYNAGKV